MDYWHKAWACPFFLWDDRMKVGCEGGSLRFPSPEVAVQFMERYCASVKGFRECCLAAALEKHYEKEIDNNDQER